jgi:hypothetical protein
MMLWAVESRFSRLQFSIILVLLVLGVARALVDREQRAFAREHQHTGDEDKGYAKHNGNLPRKALRKQHPRAFGDASHHALECPA